MLTKKYGDLTFNDLSAEIKRTYTFPDGSTVTIEKPLWLNVSKSGNHRVIVEGNSTVFVPVGWRKLQWWNNDQFDPIQF